MALETNLVYYYKMNGNSNDEVSSNNGSDTAITYGTGNGIRNQGASFNGSTSIIALGTAIGMPAAMSIGFWVKPSDYTHTGLMFCDWSTAAGKNDGWYAMNRGDLGGVIQFTWNKTGAGAGTAIYQTSSAALTDNTTWHFIVITQTGTSAPIMYVDGSSVGVTLAFGSPVFTKPSGQGSAIGSSTDSGVAGSEYFQGAIDELGIWTRVLTSGEVSTLYNGGTGGTLASGVFVFSTDYVLSLGVGAFTLTGISLAIHRTWHMAMGAGVFTLTGIACALHATTRYTLSLARGIFALTGVNLAFKRTRTIIMGTGAFTLTGWAINVSKTWINKVKNVTGWVNRHRSD